MLFMFFAICVLACSGDFLSAKNVFKYEYDLLFIFVVLSAVCLCFCNEFLLIYLAIELQSLTFYIFATFNRNSEFSTEAGLKYFIFGGIVMVVIGYWIKKTMGAFIALLSVLFAYLYFAGSFNRII